MNKSQNFNFSLDSYNFNLKESFIRNDLKLTVDQLQKVMGEYIGNTIMYISPLQARKLHIVIKDSHDVSITLQNEQHNNDVEVKTAIFYPFIAQSLWGLFMVVVSEFNVYDYLNREPSNEAIGEFRFQKNLAKALGIQNLSAYDSQNFSIIDEEIIVTHDLKLMYKWDERNSYLTYRV